MTLLFEDEYGKPLPFDARKLALEVAEHCLDYEGCPYEAEITLLLTDNATIRDMNRDYRGIDRETDVLSFPLLEYEHPGDFSSAEELPADSFHPETGELLLGDIVISVDKMLEQAKNYGHLPVREFAFLIAHSMLHLMGYDHMETSEAQVMEQKQEEILEQLGIIR